jgi:nicotinic acid phosphoribosyltransferase
MPRQKDKLPRGIWYEVKKKRYRVRLYRNNSPFLFGYYPDIHEAIAALAKLRYQLKEIPKLKRNQKEERKLHKPNIAGILQTITEDIFRHPGSKRIAKK